MLNKSPVQSAPLDPPPSSQHKVRVIHGTIAALALITGTLAALAISGLIGLIPFFIFFYLLLKAL
jgi:hypothetical protein